MTTVLISPLEMSPLPSVSKMLNAASAADMVSNAM